MILGRNFFITPSDSVAMIAANAQQAIPYFKDGPKVGPLGPSTRGSSALPLLLGSCKSHSLTPTRSNLFNGLTNKSKSF